MEHLPLTDPSREDDYNESSSNAASTTTDNNNTNKWILRLLILILFLNLFQSQNSVVDRLVNGFTTSSATATTTTTENDGNSSIGSNISSLAVPSSADNASMPTRMKSSSKSHDSPEEQDDSSPISNPTDTKSKSSSTAVLPLSSWCPKNAKCHDSSLCQPCKRKFLIIIASGRSASTTLTWMLDTLPGIRMTGENNDLLKKEYNLEESTIGNEVFEKAADKKNPWGHGAIPDQAVACAAQAYVEVMNPPPPASSKNDQEEEESDVILGFKTIRFQNGLKGTDQVNRMVDYVKTHFPCSRILVNYRSNVTAQTASADALGWKVNEEQTRNTNAELQQIADAFGPNQARLLDSSVWTENLTTLNDAVEWLGFSSACRFHELLEFNTDGYRNGKTSMSVNKNCHYIGG